MSEEMTYEQLAGHYDRIYHDKPYAAEASKVVAALRARGAKDRATLLDVGCGTGQHVQHLVTTFDVTGVDLHDPVLKIARDRVPQARFLEGDVTTLDLGERFQALTCLFGVIGYVETWEGLEAAIRNVAKHLEPGAPFVIESWLTPDRFEEIEGQPTLRTYRGDEVTLARTAIPRRLSGETAELEIEWLIAWPGGEIQRFSETQHLGLFEIDATLELFETHGLKASVDEEGLTEDRVLYLGNKVRTVS